MANFNPLSGWTALQLWSGAIAACQRGQIAGYGIMTQHLAELVRQAEGGDELEELMRTGEPAKVAAALKDLENTPTGQAMGDLVHDRLIRRLVSQSYELQKLIRGENADKTSGIAGYYRLRVADRLAPHFQKYVPGSNEREKKANAGIRAALAANETLPYADRYLAARAMNPDSPSLPGLLQQVRHDIQQKARRHLVSDMLTALDTYLEISDRNSRRT